jgi:hypothetical protein
MNSIGIGISASKDESSSIRTFLSSENNSGSDSVTNLIIAFRMIGN